MSQSLEASESETTKTSRAVSSGRWPTEGRSNEVRHPEHETARPRSGEPLAGETEERVFFREGELGTYNGGPLEFHDVESLGPESRPSRILYAYGARRRKQASVGALAILGTAVVFFLGALVVTRSIDLTRGDRRMPDAEPAKPVAEGAESTANGAATQGVGAKPAAAPGAAEAPPGALSGAAAGQAVSAGSVAATQPAEPQAAGAPAAALPESAATPDSASDSATSGRQGAAGVGLEGAPGGVGAQPPAQSPAAQAPVVAAPEPPAAKAPPLAPAAATPVSKPVPKAVAPKAPARPTPVAKAPPKPAAPAPVAQRPLPAAGLGASATANKKPPTASF